MHLHDCLILNIQSFVPLRWEEKILVKIAKCGWRKCLESKYVCAYTKTAKNGKFFFALFLTLQGLFYDKETKAIVRPGSWGACPQLILNNAYLRRCISCYRETLCWEERAHGNSSTDTTLFPESCFALWGAGEQVMTLNQQSTAKFIVCPHSENV